MARIDLGGKSQPDVGSLRERVVVCATVEKPDGDVSTTVTRPGVISVHARVRPLKGVEVLNWKAVFGSPHAPTHEIVIRVPPDVKVDLNHWVWHEDKFTETWFRVRTVEDLGGAGRFLVLLCSIDTVKDTRSDPAIQATPPNWETPDMDDGPVEAV